MVISGKRSIFAKSAFLVLGLAKSGFAAASILHEKGVYVTVNDQKPFDENEPAQKLSEKGVEVVCGEHPVSLFDQHQITVLIKNPGIPYENIMVQEAEKEASRFGQKLSLPTI